MKILTKVLIALLTLTSLIPIAIGYYCLFDQPGAVQFFNLQLHTNDLDKVFIVLGGFIFASLALPILSIVWLIKRKPEGFTLAYLVGAVALIRGILTLVMFNSHQIANPKLIATPIILGCIILLFTFLAHRQQQK